MRQGNNRNTGYIGQLRPRQGDDTGRQYLGVMQCLTL